MRDGGLVTCPRQPPPFVFFFFFYAGISTNKVKINVSSWVVCSAECVLSSHLHFHLFFPVHKRVAGGIFPIGQ